MLRWTLIFLVIAICAAIFGFGSVAIGAASAARILFYIFLVLFLLSLVAGVASGNWINLSVPYIKKEMTLSHPFINIRFKKTSRLNSFTSAWYFTCREDNFLNPS